MAPYRLTAFCSPVKAHTGVFTLATGSNAPVSLLIRLPCPRIRPRRLCICTCRALSCPSGQPRVASWFPAGLLLRRQLQRLVRSIGRERFTSETRHTTPQRLRVDGSKKCWSQYIRTSCVSDEGICTCPATDLPPWNKHFCAGSMALGDLCTVPKHVLLRR